MKDSTKVIISTQGQRKKTAIRNCLLISVNYRTATCQNCKIVISVVHKSDVDKK